MQSAISRRREWTVDSLLKKAENMRWIDASEAAATNLAQEKLQKNDEQVSKRKEYSAQGSQPDPEVFFVFWTFWNFLRSRKAVKSMTVQFHNLSRDSMSRRSNLKRSRLDQEPALGQRISSTNAHLVDQSTRARDSHANKEQQLGLTQKGIAENSDEFHVTDMKINVECFSALLLPCRDCREPKKKMHSPIAALRRRKLRTLQRRRLRTRKVYTAHK